MGQSSDSGSPGWCWKARESRILPGRCLRGLPPRTSENTKNCESKMLDRNARLNSINGSNSNVVSITEQTNRKCVRLLPGIDDCMICHPGGCRRNDLTHSRLSRPTISSPPSPAIDTLPFPHSLLLTISATNSPLHSRRI